MFLELKITIGVEKKVSTIEFDLLQSKNINGLEKDMKTNELHFLGLCGPMCYLL
jgi:hypothetical protein